MRCSLSTCWVLTVLASVALLCPASFGAEEAAAPDVLTLRDGAAVGCTAGVIDAQGRVSFAAPFLHGTARTRLADLLRLQLKRTIAEKAGAHIVRLTNADRFVGDLIEMTDDEVILDSALFGELEIPRAFVYSISRRSHSPVLFASDFATGSMDGWQKRSGRWTLTREGLYGTVGTDPGGSSVQRQVAHDGAVTLIILLDGREQGAGEAKPKPFRIGVSMFDDALTVIVTRGRVTGVLRNPADLARIAGGPGGIMRLVGKRAAGACDSFTEAKGELRIAYDPKAKTPFQVWLNGKATVFMGSMAGLSLKGNGIRISTNVPTTLRSVQMCAGAVEPGVENVKPAKDVDVVVMLNRDALRVKSIVMEDDQAVLQSAAGEFKLGMAKIGHITMRSDGRKALPPREGDVRMWLEDSVVTLKLAEITAERLTGQTASVGEVGVRRAAVASIDVDLLGAKRSAAAKSPQPRLPQMTLADGTALHVKVTGMKDGKVAVTAPWLVGTAVARCSELATLDLGRAGQPELQGETIYLTDGSAVGCALKTFGPKLCGFNSPILGELSARRAHISAITSGGIRGLVLAHDFRSGKLPEGSVKVGRWRLDERGLLALGTNALDTKKTCVVAVPLAYTGPLKVELVVKPDPARGRLCHTIVLYAPDVASNFFKQKGLKVFLSSLSIYVRSETGFVPRLSPRDGPFFGPRGGTVVVGVNPIASTVQCRSGKRLLGQMHKPYGPRGAKYLLLTGHAHTGSIVESLRIWKMSPLSGGGRVFVAFKAEDSIIDADGTRIRSGNVVISGGQVVGANGVKYPMTDGMTIMMAKGARVNIPRTPEHSMVRLANDSILMRIDTMDAKFLTGVSPILGKLRIPRADVQRVEFRAPNA